MANKPTKPNFPLGLESQDQSVFQEGILNNGVVEHGPDAVMTVPETPDASGVPSAVRYNEDDDQFEGYYNEGGWLPLGGGNGGRWEALPHASSSLLQAGRAYLVDNTDGVSTVLFPSPKRIGDSVTVCDLYGKFSTYPLTVDGNGKSIYGSADSMTISTDNVSATFTWTGEARGWVITSGVGLGQGRVYSREIYSQILSATTPSITLSTQPSIVDVYVDGKRLKESLYTLDGYEVKFDPALASGSDVQIIQYIPIQLGAGGGGSGGTVITWEYNGGSAIGGETQIVLDVVVDSVSEIYIRGSRQQIGRGFTFDPATSTITLADELEAGDDVVVVINGDPTVYNQIDRTPWEVARSNNVKNSEVILSTDKQSVLDGKTIVYDVVSQTSWGIPLGLPTGVKITSVNNGILVYVPGNVSVKLINVKTTKVIKHAPSDFRSIGLEDYLKKAPDIREWASDSLNDDTTRFQRALNDGVTSIWLPDEDIIVGELNVPTSLKIVGTSSQSINKNGSRILKAAGAGFAIHFNGQEQTTRPMGGGIYDTLVTSQNYSDEGSLIKVTSWSYFKMINSSMQNFSGWGLILKDTMESKVYESLFRRLGGENSGGILLDDYLGVQNSNVNNLHIDDCTWAGMSGAWVKFSDISNVDVLWFTKNKVEWDFTPNSANLNSKYVIDIGQASRVYIDRNTFTHFRNDATHNLYNGILHMGPACRGIVDFTNNKAYGTTGYLWDVEGGSLHARNTQTNRADASSSAITRVTSNKRQDIEDPVFITNDMNLVSKPAGLTNGFISCHDLPGTVGNLYVVDADSLKSTSMLVPAGIEARRYNLSKEYLLANKAVSITVRVKSQDLAAGAKLKLNIDGVTDINTLDVPTTGWSLLNFVVQPSSLGSGGLRFSNVGTNPLLFDGIKIETATIIEVGFAWAPGVIPANTQIISPAQSGLTGFDNPGSVIKGFSVPSFNGNCSGLLVSVTPRNSGGGWEVLLRNNTAVDITTTFTRCKVCLFV